MIPIGILERAFGPVSLGDLKLLWGQARDASAFLLYCGIFAPRKES